MTNKQQQMIEYFKKDRFAASIGIKLIEVGPGYALAKLEICDNHLNAIDSVQGGVTFTLADFAFGVASNSYGQVAVGINVSITYFRPPKGKVLIAEAKEIYANSKLASYNVDVFDDNKDVIVANFIGMVYRKKDQHNFE
jgi:acyl-CoA thioesterase